MYLAEVSQAAFALPTPALGLPSLPPKTPDEVTGVVIHWVKLELPTEGHVLRVAPTVPVQAWARHIFSFAALSSDHLERPPQTTVEKEAYVLLAAYMVLARYALSSQTTLLWEVWPGPRLKSTAAFRVGSHGRVVGVHGPEAP